ncbi:hypothetical protein SK128_010545 [Halocaridina rubra]|uniref:Uncharacterized protein n=1 Tax=Halocaridina rubra TaxID=373956 RepID=A0AAN8WVS5_HALRR
MLNQSCGINLTIVKWFQEHEIFYNKKLIDDKDMGKKACLPGEKAAELNALIILIGQGIDTPPVDQSVNTSTPSSRKSRLISLPLTTHLNRPGHRHTAYRPVCAYLHRIITEVKAHQLALDHTSQSAEPKPPPQTQTHMPPHSYYHLSHYLPPTQQGKQQQHQQQQQIQHLQQQLVALQGQAPSVSASSTPAHILSLLDLSFSSSFLGNWQTRLRPHSPLASPEHQTSIHHL